MKILARILQWLIYGPMPKGYASALECPPQPDLRRAAADGMRGELLGAAGACMVTINRRKRRRRA